MLVVLLIVGLIVVPSLSVVPSSHCSPCVLVVTYRYYGHNSLLIYRGYFIVECPVTDAV